MLLFVHLLSICFIDYLFTFQNYTYREGEIFLPSIGLHLQWLQWPQLSQAEARSQEFHLNVSHVWQGSKYSGHLPLLFPGHWQEAGSEAEKLGHKPVPIWHIIVIGSRFTCHATMLALVSFFLFERQWERGQKEGFKTCLDLFIWTLFYLKGKKR